MRLVCATVVAGLTAGFAWFGAPSAVAAPGSVTVCAKGLAKGAPLLVEVGFISGDGDVRNAFPLANEQCVAVGQAPAPSGAWVEANREAKRIVVKTRSGKTHVKKSERADFSLSSGDNVTVTFWYGKK